MAGLADASLPAVDVRSAPDGDPATWDGVSFTAGESAGAPLAGVGLDASGDGWSLTLEEPGWRFTVPPGTDGWTVAEPVAPDGIAVPVAVSGGWDDAGRLRFDVVFLQTPHRLAVACDLDDVSVRAAWVTVPLWDAPMSQLRAPRP